MKELTKTTRELILDKIQKHQDEIELLKLIIDKNKQTEDFKQMHFIEIDILKGNIERLRKAIIENSFEEQF
jgi:hypothetical protein